jgi:ABC-type Zn2+ transport system substrate-binding protein/surface adhesin
MSLLSRKIARGLLSLLFVINAMSAAMLAVADSESCERPKDSKQQMLFSNKPLALLYSALLPELAESPKAVVAADQIIFAPESNMHDYQLSLNDLQRIQRAGVIYWYGPLVEPQLAKLKSRFSDKRWLALANSEHAWLSFEGMENLLNGLSDELKREGMRAELIDAQKQKVSKQLLAIKAKYQKVFKPFAEQKFLLGHSAFSQLLEELGLNGAVIYSAGHSHGHHGHGEKDKLAIQQQIAAGDIYCAVAEPDLSFEQLQRRFNQLTVVELEPMAGSVDLTHDGFAQFLEKSLTALQQCLQRVH